MNRSEEKTGIKVAEILILAICIFSALLPGILLRLFLGPNSSNGGEGWPRLSIWAALLVAAGVIVCVGSLVEAPPSYSVKKSIILRMIVLIIGVLCVIIGLSALNYLGD